MGFASFCMHPQEIIVMANSPVTGYRLPQYSLSRAAGSLQMHLSHGDGPHISYRSGALKPPSGDIFIITQGYATAVMVNKLPALMVCDFNADRATEPEGHRTTGPQSHKATEPQGH